MLAFTACLVFLQMEPMPTSKLIERFPNCVSLLSAAKSHGLDPLVIGSIAYRESRFAKEETSSKGAVGILQVLPKYWCPRGRRKGCNLTLAGFKAWKTYRRGRTMREALCRYSSGSRCSRNRGGRLYAKRVLSTFNKLKRTMRIKE